METAPILSSAWDPPRKSRPGQKAPPEGTGTAQPVVLIVEDDEGAVDVAVGLMSMLGYRTRIARDGHEALMAVARGLPDLILLDIHLPELDGISFMKVLRRVAEARTVPVVAVSAVYPPDGPVARMLEGLGVSQYLSKPFNLASLRQAVAAAHPDGPAKARSEAESSDASSEWVGRGLPCRAWIGGQQLGMCIEKADPTTVTVLAPKGAFRPGTPCRLELVVRRVVADAMTETPVRVLAKGKGCVGVLGASERWSLDVQASIPSMGVRLIAWALKD